MQFLSFRDLHRQLLEDQPIDGVCAPLFLVDAQIHRPNWLFVLLLPISCMSVVTDVSQKRLDAPPKTLQMSGDLTSYLFSPCTVLGAAGNIETVAFGNRRVRLRALA